MNTTWFKATADAPEVEAVVETERDAKTGKFFSRFYAVKRDKDGTITKGAEITAKPAPAADGE